MSNPITQTKLQALFPVLRSESDVWADICRNPELSAEFASWPKEHARKFLDFCSGVRGVKLLYDVFFKEILNPEATPERLEEFLSLLLHEQVRILAVLPNDTTRIADESTLLITDIVIERENHEIVNLEVQKIGYKFPGERCACYSADMLLRQYKRIRSQKRQAFSYKDIRTVYTIVLFEKSPQEFHLYPNEYLHYFSQQSNTGLEIELLQKYLLIPLDIFYKIQHNKNITNKLDAWLVFLSMDDPEMILKLVETYPEFMPLYEQVYSHCRNVDEVMRMFSEELRELDRNTVQLMIDEMQEELNGQKRANEEMRLQNQGLQKQNQTVKEQLETERKQHETERKQYAKERQQMEERIRQLEQSLRQS